MVGITVNMCEDCGIVIGCCCDDTNRRQLCGNTRCLYRVELSHFRVYFCQDNECLIHVQHIILVGKQFDSIKKALEWRVMKIREISEWSDEERKTFEFPYLVSKNDNKFICPKGNVFDFEYFM